MRALLERLGDPEEIAAEAGARAMPVPPRGAEAWVPWLLLLGGFVLVLGWLVGVVLLLASASWRSRDKLLGTLVVPGGLALPLLLLGFPTGSGTCSGSGRPGAAIVTHCTTSGLVLPLWAGIAVLVVLLVAPVVVAVHLERARRRA